MTNYEKYRHKYLLVKLSEIIISDILKEVEYISDIIDKKNRVGKISV